MLISGSDPVTNALRSALDGLSLREQVTANNIANVDTPGFTASSVDFEDSLRAAIGDGSIVAGDAQATTAASTAAPGADGNNVDLATEEMTAVQASYQYQLVTRAVGDRFAMISTAIGGA